MRRRLRGLLVPGLGLLRRGRLLLRRECEHHRVELVVLVRLLLVRGVVRAIEAATREATLLEAEGVDAVALALLLLEVGAAAHARAVAQPLERADGGGSGAHKRAGCLHNEGLCARQEGDDQQQNSQNPGPAHCICV